jgi:Rrf2 family protein
VRYTQTLAYAISAVIELAQLDTDEPVSSANLASHTHIPSRYLLQILRRLVSAGVLRSVRGTIGGYALGRPASKITLLEIIDAVDESGHVPEQFRQSFSDETCERLLTAIKESNDASRQALGQLTLAELSQTGFSRTRDPKIAPAIAPMKAPRPPRTTPPTIAQGIAPVTAKIAISSLIPPSASPQRPKNQPQQYSNHRHPD